MKLTAAIIIFCSLFFISPNVKAEGLSIIRDSETENFLYDLTRPIFKAAGLNPDDIKIYIINDSSLNAFVAGGQNVFINTGLITKYDRPEILIGVIAHEAAHIAAGHLARSSEEMNNMGNAMILTYLAGIAAAIANPDAGMALIMGGNQMGQRMAMKFSRTQEEAADGLAIRYLDRMNYSPAGLLELLQYFDREESSYKNDIDEYALTHPVSKKRINFIKSFMGKSHYYDNEKIDKFLTPRLERINVKLQAFIDDPNRTLAYYSNKNNPNASYAKSIAYFKKGKINESLNEIDQQIKISPQDGYLWELRGQVLFESGAIKNAIIAYKKAVELQKENPTLSRIALASAVITLNSGDKELTNYAIDNLILATKTEDNDPNIYKQLAAAYNQNNDSGHAYLSLSQFNLLTGDKEKTLKYAKLAKENLDKKDVASLIKAEDIIATVKLDKKNN